MFTGLVEADARIVAVGPQFLAAALPVPPEDPVRDGESIAINGCCLTALPEADGTVRFELSGETLRRTTLADLHAGESVNWERALRAGDRLGGHFVQGHVDEVGIVIALEPREGWVEARFQVSDSGARYLADKGSIAVDGISLTVVEPAGREFGCAIVPHTWAHTNLHERRAGDRVNLEFDLLAKHVARLLDRA